MAPLWRGRSLGHPASKLFQTAVSDLAGGQLVLNTRRQLLTLEFPVYHHVAWHLF